MIVIQLFARVNKNDYFKALLKTLMITRTTEHKQFKCTKSLKWAVILKNC